MFSVYNWPPQALLCMGSVNSNHSQGKISTVLIHIWQMGNWGTAWLLISVHSDWSLPLVISGFVTWTLQLQTETTAPSFLVGKMPSMQSVASRQFTGALGELRHGGSRRTLGSWGLHFELWVRNRTEWYKTRWVCTGLGVSPTSYPDDDAGFPGSSGGILEGHAQQVFCLTI